MPIKLIAFDKGWVLFRPMNWDIIREIGLNIDEQYWLVRELWRINDWINFQFKRGKTSRQIISVIKKSYPNHAKLWEQISPLLKKVISVDFKDNVKLGQDLQKSGYLVEIWSDNAYLPDCIRNIIPAGWTSNRWSFCSFDCYLSEIWTGI